MIIYAYDGTPILEIKVDDSSYKYEEIMGDCNIYLEFSLTEHIEIQPGAYIMFQGVKYEMMSRSNVAIQHTRNYEYKATFSGPQARLGRYVIYDTLSGRLRFDMIGKPEDHLALVFRNLGMREPNTWEIGSVVTDKSEVLVSYNHTSVRDALNAIAEAFDTEWSVSLGSGGKMQINLRKLEFNKDNPLALGYGKNLGFKPGVGRVNYGDFGQVQKVWIDGGDRNLSIGEYGFTTLHFPKSLAFDADSAGNLRYTIDGQTYTEDGFDGATALGFVTDEFGASVKVAEAANNCVEASLDLTQHYPKRVGHVSDVRYLYKGDYMTYAELVTAYPDLTEEDWLEVQVHIVDDSLATAPGDEGGLDYSKHLFGNDQPLTVIFQTGQLMGREFNATFVKEARTREGSGSGSGSGTIVVRPANRFELVRTTIDGVDMPNAVFRPNANSGDMDEYIVVNIYLPDEYICNFPSFEGAEIDALRDAVKFIRENMDPQFSFKGTVDDVYARRNWLNIGGKLILGGCISFQNAQIQPEPIVTRIVGIKTYINKPYAPELTLSNETVRGGMSSMLAKLRAEDEHVMEQVKDGRRFSQRSFRDAKETIAMLAGTIDYFSEGIQPITVETMSLLVGYEALQFKFWTTRQCVTPVVNPVIYDPDTHTVVMPACVIQHMTLGIRDIMPNESRTYSDYLRWTMNSFESAPLTGVDEQGNDISGMAFYVYAKVDADNVAGDESEHIAGEFYLADENHKKVMQRKLEPETEVGPDGVTRHWYYLLVGILNSEYEGGRSFAPLYGFTEVLPGQITTDVIRSASGASYFDLANEQFVLGQALTFLNNELVLNGAFVQSGNRKYHLGAFRGQWTDGEWYYPGDEVWWQSPNGAISSYIYIYETPSQASSSNNPTNTAYWQVFAQGVAGSSGDSSLSVDLINEVDGLAVGSDAVLSVSVDLLTTISAYLGTTATNITGIKASVPSGFSSDIDVKRLNGSSWTSIKSNSYITVNASSIDLKVVIDADTDFTGVNSVPITIEVQCGTNGERELTFTILPVCEGEDGAVFRLMPSHTAVKGSRSGNNISYSPTTVTCTRTMAKGGSYSEVGSSSPYYGVLKYSKDGGSTKLDYPSGGVQASQAASAGKIIFYWYADSAMTTLLDQETVPIVVDGETGNGIDDIEEYYAFSPSGNTPPGTWTYGPDLPAGTRPSQSDLLSHTGEYLWTKTVIKYTDTSKPDVEKVFAQYLPNNGTNGVNGPMLVGRGKYDCDETGEQMTSGHQVYYGDDKIRNVVWYDNGTTARWYMTLDVRSVPAQSGSNSFSNIPPSNADYWAPFDGSFANVATGLLFARKAYLENAIVRFLETADAGSARIVAETNNLCMYDGVSDDPKLLITGNNLSVATNPVSFNFPSSQYASFQTNSYRGNASAIMRSSGISFNVAGDGAVLVIPDIQVDLNAGLNSYSGNNSGFVYMYLAWELTGPDGTDTWFGEGPYSGEFGRVGSYSNKQYTDRITFEGGRLPISRGQYTLKLYCEMNAYGCGEGNTDLIFIANASPYTTYNNFTVGYPMEKTEIGANGFQVVYSATQLFKCVIDSNDVVNFRMQCDDVGIEVSSNGSGGTMWIRLGGQWYTASRNGSGYLVLTPDNNH